ncbi:MAG: hypothetical protein D6775_02185 [Caldilineae bacterium]|nr:MAG: hypothetical protein D6775_02185 [Caldilineae bacterium]
MEAHNEEILASLLLITFLAALVPMLAMRLRRVRIPVVVGEIVVGILIGRSGLNLIEPNAILDFLAWFGFIFLMFISGLELDFDLLSLPRDEEEHPLRQPLPLALLVFLLTLVMGLVAGMLLERAGEVEDPFLMGLILSTTSLGVVVPVLKEQHLITSRFGQTLLISALLADFVTLLLFSLDVALISSGLTLDLLLLLVLLAVFGVFVRTGRGVSRLPFIRRLTEEIAEATAQIEVRGSFALMVAWAALASVMGVEVILGAFLAGAILSLITDRHESVLREKLDAFGFGFFIPIFFIMVGVNFDAGALAASRERVLLVPLLLLIAFGIKFVAALVLRLQFDWRETLAGGALLSARLSLIIAASAIALDLHVIDSAMNSAIILVALVTVTLAPVGFHKVLPPQPAAVARSGFIVVGSREMAALLARRLAVAEPVSLISRRRMRIAPEGNGRVRCIVGDATDPETLRRAGAESAGTLIALSLDAHFNEKVCRLAAERFGIERIITWAENGQHLSALEALGVKVVRPQLATLLTLEGAARFPDAFDILTHQAEDIEVGEAVLRNRAYHRRALREIHLPGDVLVVGIRRGDKRIVPHGDTTLQIGDLLMLVGMPHHLAEALDLVQTPGHSG